MQTEHTSDAPLRVAVNVAGSGFGGSSHDKGQLIDAIVPRLTDVARETGVDVVLVCWGRRQYAAAQRRRQRLDAAPWSDTPDAARLDRVARRLADHARRGELVLFLGAGVSMGAKLPSWNELLDVLVRDAPGSTMVRSWQLASSMRRIGPSWFAGASHRARHTWQRCCARSAASTTPSPTGCSRLLGIGRT